MHPDCTTLHSASLFEASRKEIFWRSILIGDGCWEWQGITATGYGAIYLGDQRIRAHRFSWELHFGPIPDGMLVCHHCDNRLCVRPSHLFLGSSADNIHDAIAKGRLDLRRPRRKHTVRFQKLSPAQIDEIRCAYAAGGTTQEHLANIYHCSHSMISMVVHHKRRT